MRKAPNEVEALYAIIADLSKGSSEAAESYRESGRFERYCHGKRDAYDTVLRLILKRYKINGLNEVAHD
jgi:hypothetical protein